MIPNLSELCVRAVFDADDCGGDLKLQDREQGGQQFLMDHISRFAASVCYTTNIADLLLTDMLNTQIEGCIVNKLCEGKHSYELGWVDSSYRLTRTKEDMWTVSVIVRSRKYQTRRHAWLMADEEDDPPQLSSQEKVDTSKATVMRDMRRDQSIHFAVGFKIWGEFAKEESVFDLKYTEGGEFTELTSCVQSLTNHLSGDDCVRPKG